MIYYIIYLTLIDITCLIYLFSTGNYKLINCNWRIIDQLETFIDSSCFNFSFCQCSIYCIFELSFIISCDVNFIRYSLINIPFIYFSLPFGIVDLIEVRFIIYHLFY